MRFPARSAVRWAAGALVAATALGAAFSAGVLAGAARQPAPDPAPGLLDEAAEQIEAAALHPVGRDVLDAAAIAGMLEVAGDDWGSWGTVGDAPATPSGHVGVGLWLRPGPAGAVVVAEVAAGSPAERAGVLADDEVRAVDGRSARGLSAAVVAAAVRGAPGSRVTLVLRRGPALRTVALERAVVPRAGVVTQVHRRPGGGPAVAVVTVPAFVRGVGRDVRAAVAAARRGDLGGVLLDVRGNPGGLLDEAVETASAFLDGGPVVHYTRRDGEPTTLEAVGDGDTTLPLAVLVDGGTASAAEVVVGALQDRERAVVIGSRTFGKGSVQEPHRLSDGSSLEITVARYVTPAGRSVEGVGLAPDLAVASGSDPEVAVRRGIEVLTGLLAAAPAGGAR